MLVLMLDGFTPYIPRVAFLYTASSQGMAARRHQGSVVVLTVGLSLWLVHGFIIAANATGASLSAIVLACKIAGHTCRSLKSTI
jgi:hypothetical protein